MTGFIPDKLAEFVATNWPTPINAKDRTEMLAVARRAIGDALLIGLLDSLGKGQGPTGREWLMSHLNVLIHGTRYESGQANESDEAPKSELRSMPPIWMVKGKGPASYIHGSEAYALQEAKRLAANHPGEQFTVMVSTRSFVASIEEIDRSYEDDGIPF